MLSTHVKINKNHTVIISARCVGVTGVVVALVDVGAVVAVAAEARVAGTCVAAVGIFTCSIYITWTISTLVVVGAGEAVARVARVADTLKTASSIRA